MNQMNPMQMLGQMSSLIKMIGSGNPQEIFMNFIRQTGASQQQMNQLQKMTSDFMQSPQYSEFQKILKK